MGSIALPQGIYSLLKRACHADSVSSSEPCARTSAACPVSASFSKRSLALSFFLSFRTYSQLAAANLESCSHSVLSVRQQCKLALGFFAMPLRSAAARVFRDRSDPEATNAAWKALQDQLARRQLLNEFRKLTYRFAKRFHHVRLSPYHERIDAVE